MSKRALIGALGVGAGLMYFYDPRLGRGRRSRMRDHALAAMNIASELYRKAERDATNRLHGVTERLRNGKHGPAAEVIVEARVRAQIGRLTSHPHSIAVEVRGGDVVLAGPVPRREASRLVRKVRRVPGVRDVIDHLDRHIGQDLPRRGLGRNWSPVTQLAAAAAGTVIAGVGLVRGGLLGKLIAAAGGVLAARGVSNQPVRELLGIGGGHGIIALEKTITVHAPIAAVYELWSDVENFPRFMQHVKEIRIHADDPDRSHWVVDGTPGTALWFDAEVTQRVPDHVIAWRTLPRQAIGHAGMVLFEDLGHATRVHVHLAYEPPAGRVGHTVARILGWDPKSRMDEDLLRMKALLENGHTRAHHARVTLGEIH